MGGKAARDVAIPLDFLGPGRFRAEIIQDDMAGSARIARRTEVLDRRGVVRAKLAPAGGALLHASRYLAPNEAADAEKVGEVVSDQGPGCGV